MNVKAFKINQLVYNSKTKEVMKITNGIEKDGSLQPTEAVVFRFLGMNIEDKPILSIAHITVEPQSLAILVEATDEYPEFEMDFSISRRKHFVFRGRI